MTKNSVQNATMLDFWNVVCGTKTNIQMKEYKVKCVQPVPVEKESDDSSNDSYVFHV